jgi:hypothetical protein
MRTATLLSASTKTDVIRRRGPWKGIDEVEFATLEWVALYNTRGRTDAWACSRCWLGYARAGARSFCRRPGKEEPWHTVPNWPDHVTGDESYVDRSRRPGDSVTPLGVPAAVATLLP